MGHAAIDNQTRFAVELVFPQDEEARPLCVPIVQATYQIEPQGGLSLAEKPHPIPIGGVFWGDPETSSYKYEPQIAFCKPGTDLVLIGHAHANQVGQRETLVTFQVGALEKTVRVVGDRVWKKSMGVVVMSEPQPFERIPLIWERAFGGWDRSHPDPEKHTFEPRNTVGVGFHSMWSKFEEGLPLPNLEDPKHYLNGWGHSPPPAGFGFTLPHWKPRNAFAGTYDKKWMTSRRPLFPVDFDRRFFNAASPGLIAPGDLKGDEPVCIVNASCGAPVRFQLPGVPPPNCLVQLTARRDFAVSMRLDTVIVNLDARVVLMQWRGQVAVRNGPHDVVSIRVSADH